MIIIVDFRLNIEWVLYMNYNNTCITSSECLIHYNCITVIIDMDQGYKLS